MNRITECRAPIGARSAYLYRSLVIAFAVTVAIVWQPGPLGQYATLTKLGIGLLAGSLVAHLLYLSHRNEGFDSLEPANTSEPGIAWCLSYLIVAAFLPLFTNVPHSALGITTLEWTQLMVNVVILVGTLFILALPSFSMDDYRSLNKVARLPFYILEIIAVMQVPPFIISHFVDQADFNSQGHFENLDATLATMAVLITGLLYLVGRHAYRGLSTNHR